MSLQLKLPIGYENFEELRTKDFYYVDKTKLVEQLIDNIGKVNLFTRPRRFGKTLNMSMLKSFFEIGTNSSLFDGLYISNNNKICEEYMGKYPVVFITLKNVDGSSFKEAKDRLIDIVAYEAKRFSYLLEADTLSIDEKDSYKAITNMVNGSFTIDEKNLLRSLKTLSELLCKYHNQRVVILIDEYDVPLDKAFKHGYYKEMVSLIRGIFGDVLKTNDALEFAVLTGCLRVSKESIFTGLNNFKTLSITDSRFDEMFGFTDDEVKEMLKYYNLESKLDECREWYDGYRFGNTNIYCPWDVINYVDRIKDDKNALPESYWINTSGNDLVKRFIDKANKTTRDEIERLIEGESIQKKIRLDLTYDEIDNSVDNLWSVLFTTGYLTFTTSKIDGTYELLIPNREVKEVFVNQIQEWFNEKIFSKTSDLEAFWSAFEIGNTNIIENYLNRLLSNSISVFDTREKENSYHNLMLGILTGNENWLVKSNVEAGEGFADIIVETDDPDAGIILELKFTKDISEMEGLCQKALKQIDDKRYFEFLLNQDRTNVLLYGMCFCKKRCKVIAKKLEK